MKTLLFRPFEKYSEKQLFLTGSLFTILGAGAAYSFGLRLDGVLDAHLSKDVSLVKALVDNIISIACLFCVLFISAKMVNLKTRAIDILNASMVARIPMYLLTLFNINQIISGPTEIFSQYKPEEIMAHISFSSLWIIVAFGLVSILFVVWYIALLYNGYKVASNGKGLKSIVLFIVSIVLAEILSKVLILYLN